MDAPHGPRNIADAWAEGPEGKFWGTSGAAGLLAHDAERGVLLQLRADWSHHGGTWGLPGGARHEGESALDGAFREAFEEAGVPRDALVVTATQVFDVGYWSYTTVVTSVRKAFEPVEGDAESVELAWVSVDGVADLPLHPGFAARWPVLRERLDARPLLIVDVANVMGSRPDGWWRDRPSAARRVIAEVDALVTRGVPGGLMGAGADWTLFPEAVAVVEGKARGVGDAESVRVIDAPNDGDSAIVAAVEAAPGRDVTVATSDRGLRDRVRALGARCVGAGALMAAQRAVSP